MEILLLERRGWLPLSSCTLMRLITLAGSYLYFYDGNAMPREDVALVYIVVSVPEYIVSRISSIPN
jgi:hypothetical protein